MRNKLRPYYSKYKSLKEVFRDQLFGSYTYKKFIILSDARTGSTLLMKLLDAHPEIIALGEEFKILNGYSCRQIWNKIYRKRPKEVNWVGFKLFYFHPSKGNDREIWELIEEDDEIVIIHLTRRNILRSYLSKQIGLKTRKWTENVHRPHQIEQADKMVYLDQDKCRENFESIARFIVQSEKRFKRHNIIPVSYEDLDESKQGTMDKIYKELGVANFQVCTNMKKQNPEKLEKLIVNYSELKREFSGTQWEYLFAE